MEVDPKTLDNLMHNSRFKDEVYTMCVCFQAELLQTIRNVELKNQSSKDTQDNPA